MLIILLFYELRALQHVLYPILVLYNCSSLLLIAPLDPQESHPFFFEKIVWIFWIFPLSGEMVTCVDGGAGDYIAHLCVYFTWNCYFHPSIYICRGERCHKCMMIDCTIGHTKQPGSLELGVSPKCYVKPWLCFTWPILDTFIVPSKSQTNGLERYTPFTAGKKHDPTLNPRISSPKTYVGAVLIL